MSIDKLYQETAKKYMRELDRILLTSLIGSKILSFDIKPIKGRKTMYTMTILTDAKPVIEELASGGKVIHGTNRIKVKVKL